MKRRLQALVTLLFIALCLGSIPIAAGLFARCIFWLLCLGWHFPGRFLQ